MEKYPEEAAAFHIDGQAFYEAIVNSTEDYIYIVDMKTDVALVSSNMLQDFELPGILVNGLVPLWGELIHEKDKKRYFDSVDDMLSGITDEHNVEYQVRNRNNEYVWVVCRGLLKRDEDNMPVSFAGVVTPIGSKGKVDRTTGLFTQDKCRERVEDLLEPGFGKGGLLLLGLDDFKQINNLKDHIFGDLVLRQMAQNIQQMLPPRAEIFRFDGDEFAVVCPDVALEDIWELYQSIHQYANMEHEIDGISYFCSVSGGISVIGEDADNYLDLLKFAASALDASKKKGKNTCTVFSPALLQSELRTMELNRLLQR
ncbi:sensor domain-containing diguanylate cyclase, partial [Anaerostipes sp.]|uniref:sensor domain-containing diguanylate cyclase n=1 Tax=Anaerostipes sp. TaxID=1872530 RepID=UPI0025C599BE